MTHKTEAKVLGIHRSAAMATFETTDTEMNVFLLTSFQTRDWESKNLKAGKLPALIAVGFHYETNLKTTTQPTHETMYTTMDMAREKIKRSMKKVP